MEEIVIIPVPEDVSKALLKEYNRLEKEVKSNPSPFIKNVCSYRMDLINKYIYGDIRQRV